MTRELQGWGYALEEGRGVWIRPGFTGISYNDGDETEERIASIIQGAVDLGVGSAELARHCRDWPTTYHLSGSRSNLLKPFRDSLYGLNVLELGAGCGAITRFLGECGANVTAIEGSLRRAEICRSRVRDLANVEVVCEDIFSCQLGRKYDRVLLIGVVEYAGLYSDSKDPAIELLKLAKGFLSPGGKVFVAIENQLGIKYLAGAAEDHLGLPGVGVEGGYLAEGGVRTYGRAVLGKLIECAGLAEQEWYVPLPDYKLPVSVLRREAFETEEFDAGWFVRQTLARDLQLPRYLGFAPDAAMAVLHDNGVAFELANSFLVSCGDESTLPPNRDIIGWHFGGSRARRYSKTTHFRRVPSGGIQVECEREEPSGDDAASEGGALIFDPKESAAYVRGRALSSFLLTIIQRDGWVLQEAGAFFLDYFESLELILGDKGFASSPVVPGTVLPGQAVDWIPQNIIRTPEGNASLIDEEWIHRGSLDLEFVVFRGVLATIRTATRIGFSDFQGHDRPIMLVMGLMRAAGFTVDWKTMGDLLEYELGLQASVADDAFNPDHVRTWFFSGRIRSHGAYTQIRRLENELERNRPLLEMQVNWHKRTARIQALNATGEDLRHALVTQVLRDKSGFLAVWRQTLWSLERTFPRFSKLLGGVGLFAKGILQGRGLSGFRSRARARLWIEMGLFDPGWYISRYEEARLARILPVEHWIRIGWHRGYDPSPLFDTSLFLENGGTVSDSGDPISAFLQTPAHAIPSPHWLFDVQWYREKNRDMVEAGVNPLVHFLNTGGREGNSPHPLFDTSWYLAQYPDVASAGLNPLIHFVESGWVEGRKPNPLFETQWYLDTYSDELEVGVNPLWDYIYRGASLGRDPHPLFSTRWYLEKNEDVRNHGFNPLAHYLELGQSEGRKPNPIFSPSWYVHRYAKEIGEMNALHHFYEFGDSQGMRPIEWFDPDWYRANYLGESSEHPRAAQHYYEIGRNEGFLPNPNGIEDLPALVRYGRCEPARSAAAWHRDSVRTTRFVNGERPGFSREQYSALEKLYLDLLDNALRYRRCPEYVSGRSGTLKDRPRDLRTIAFYLPQFHRIPENDSWWGSGFTEWTNVTKAVPQFDGHCQPQLPEDLGLYDLRMPVVQMEQAKLARSYGIDGFCYHYYWFDGRRLLETPITQMLHHPEIDISFCVCWANEHWTRRWDGSEHEVLMEQRHTPESDVGFINELVQFFNDPRYIKVDGRPVVLVYRVDIMPEPEATVARWRSTCLELGVGNPYLMAVQSFGLGDPTDLGFDAAVEFPPHGVEMDDLRSRQRLLNPSFRGSIYSYKELVKKKRAELVGPRPTYRRHACVMPGWDNEARRPGRGHVFHGATPRLYQEWLKAACESEMRCEKNTERLVFINAWNEWAEGAHLEPDRRYGHAFLKATENALKHFVVEGGARVKVDVSWLLKPRVPSESEVLVLIHVFDRSIWEEIRRKLDASMVGRYDIWVTLSDPGLRDAIVADLPTGCQSIAIALVPNKGRDVGAFVAMQPYIERHRFKVVLKLHTKGTSGGEQGVRWRQDLLEKVLPDPSGVDGILRAFHSNPELGLVFPTGHWLPLDSFWGAGNEGSANREQFSALSTQMGFSNQPTEQGFPAGSIFWFRPEAITPVRDLLLNWDMFPEETGQSDGTIAHALERLVGLCVTTDDWEVGSTGSVVPSEPPCSWRSAGPYPFAQATRNGRSYNGPVDGIR